MRQARGTLDELRPMNVSERVENQLRDAERRVADLTRAREILAKNPDLSELLEIMSRSHF